MNILYFILISIFWGGSFLAINLSLHGFSPFLAATLRVFLATLFTLGYVKWKKVEFPRKTVTIQATANGLIGLGIPWALLFWGEQYVAPALCSIINSTTPIFTVIFTAIIVSSKQDRMTWNKWMGVILGFIGIAVIFGPFISGKSLQNTEGLVAVVGMALCYGISIAWLKRYSPHISSIMALFLECVGALIILIPISIVYGVTSYSLTGQSLLVPALALLYLSIFSTTIAFILFYKLLRDVGTVQATATLYMVPIVSIFLDWLILDKWIGTHALFGALIVFAALRLIHRPTIVTT